MKAAIHTLGCKVNQYESQYIAEDLQRHGYEIVACEADADVYIINSCSVTAQSDRKTRQTVRHYRRLHPEALILLCGCMPQAFPKEAAALAEADIVFGNAGKEKLAMFLEEYKRSGQRYVSIIPHTEQHSFCEGISGFRERTRAYIKIEDGCNRFCSYCVVPHARGRVRSKPPEEIRLECERLRQAGFRELVLVGINLSAYGSGLGLHLSDAVAIAAQVPGIERIRLGSLEPDHVTAEEISALSKIETLCPQFHISLQSGCDETLRRMNRHYSTQEYRRLCEELRRVFPDCTLTTDVMVGFPGESEAEFAESLAFIREIAFEKIHIFPYSRRKGTPAAEHPQQVSKAEKEKRCRALTTASQEIRSAFLSRQIGRELWILPEEAGEGYLQGYTANYTPVRVYGAEYAERGGLLRVRVQAVTDDCCVGVL